MLSAEVTPAATPAERGAAEKAEAEAARSLAESIAVRKKEWLAQRNKSAKVVQFAVGELVMVRNPAIRQAAFSKLQDSWEGPFKIIAVGKSPATFMVSQLPAGRSGSTHVSHMKPFRGVYPPVAIARGVGAGPQPSAIPVRRVVSAAPGAAQRVLPAVPVAGQSVLDSQVAPFSPAVRSSVPSAPSSAQSSQSHDQVLQGSVQAAPGVTQGTSLPAPPHARSSSAAPPLQGATSPVSTAVLPPVSGSIPVQALQPLTESSSSSTSLGVTSAVRSRPPSGRVSKAPDRLGY